MAQTAQIDTSHGERLSVRDKLVYGMGQGAPGLAENVINFYLLFYYTKIVQLDPGMVGIALLIGRFWDAITDPVMGYITDQTRTPFGRRRVFMVAGAVPLGLSFFLLFNPFAGILGEAAFPYLVAAFLAYSTAVTVCQVPYLTLGGELSADYHERSSVIGYRQIFWVIMILLGAGATPALTSAFAGMSYSLQESHSGWRIMALAFGGVCATLMLMAGLGTRERIEPPPRTLTPMTESLREVFRRTASTLGNPHFLLIGGVFLITQIAFAMTTSLLPFLMADWMGQPDAMTTVMMALLLTTLPFLGIWVRVSHRLGKKRSYVAGLGIMGFLAFQTMWALRPDNWNGFTYIYAALFGLGLASHMVFPWSLIPDIIDADELERGERRDGAFFGAMTFLGKTASALSLALAGLSLRLIKYDQTPDVQQSADTLLGMRQLYAFVPGIAFLCAMLLMSRFSLTRERSMEVQRGLRERAAQAQASGAAPP